MTPFTVVAQGGMFGTPELQVSKDGRLAASRPSPLEIQIWNVTSGSKVAVIAPTTPISRWALRPDGRVVAIVSEGRLSLVDITSRAAPTKVAVPANVERVDWRSDGKTLFASRGEQTDIVDGAGAVTASVPAVAAPGAISQDGRWLFTREGAMWDVRANQARWKTAAPAASVAFSDDGQSIAFTTSGQSITVADAATGNKRWEASSKGPLGSPIALSPDGQSVAAYDSGESNDQGNMVGRGMALWFRGKKARVWQPQEAVPAVRPTFSPDGKVVAFVTSSAELKLADARTGARAKQPRNAADVRPEAPQFSADGRTMFQSAASSGLFVFDMTKGERKVVGKVSTESAPTAYWDAVWSPDDGAILITTEQATRAFATIVDLKTGLVRETLDARAGTAGGRRFRSAEWNAATGLIALGRNDGVVLWDGRAKQPLRVVDTGDGESDGRQSTFSPQGHLLATLAAPNKEVRLWDPKTGARLRVLSVPGNEGADGATPDSGLIEAMAFSADGSRIALSAVLTSGVEQTTHIAIFDTATGALVRTLHAQRHFSYGGYGTATALHFTSQGRGIVSIDGSGRVDLWSTASDDPPTSLLEKGTPGYAALADGGNLLLMGSPALDVWDLRTRTVTRQFRGDGSTILRARVANSGSTFAVARVDRVDLHRLADRTYLTVRVAPAPREGVSIVADNGAFAGASTATTQLRVRDGAELEVRNLRANEVTTLNRPSLGLDFAAGCPLSPPQ